MVCHDSSVDALLKPQKLWTLGEVMSRPSPVPKVPGVYAWYFRGLTRIPLAGCHSSDCFYLLYIGISPSAPPLNGKRASSQSLVHRIRYHFSGNAEGSTLRLTLGCLLSEELKIQLRRVGSGKRMTFSTGETIISQWMSDNARVTWLQCEEPWDLERSLISTVNLPLNLDQNRQHGFHSLLSGLRREAKARARVLPVVA